MKIVHLQKDISPVRTPTKKSLYKGYLKADELK